MNKWKNIKHLKFHMPNVYITNKNNAFPKPYKRDEYYQNCLNSARRDRNFTHFLVSKILVKYGQPCCFKSKVAKCGKASAMKNTRSHPSCQSNPTFLLQNLPHSRRNPTIHSSSNFIHSLPMNLSHQPSLHHIQWCSNRSRYCPSKCPSHHTLKRLQMIPLRISQHRSLQILKWWITQNPSRQIPQ